MHPEFPMEEEMKDLDMRRSQIQKQYYNDKTQANEATENKLKRLRSGRKEILDENVPKIADK